MKLVVTPDKSDAILELATVLFYRFPSVVDELRETLAKCKKGIALEIRPYKDGHSRQQEKYYWKWLRAFADFTGDTPDEMHNDMLKIAYGTERVETVLAMRERPRMRSSTLTMEEYSKLIETLIRIAADNDFIIPPPLHVVNG